MEAERRYADDELVRPGTVGALWMRQTTVDAARYTGKIGAWLFVACGASVVQIGVVAGAALAHRGPYLTVASTAIAFGVAGLPLVSRGSDEILRRLYPWMAVGLILSGSLLTSAGLIFAGTARWNSGALIYLLSAIFAVSLLRRWAAFTAVGLSVVQYAVVVGLTEDLVAPVSQWAFLAATLIAGGTLVGGLVEHTDRLATAEHNARLGLGESNLRLEARVAEQVDQLARLERLRRFLSPPVADAVLSAGAHDLLQPHRRRIAVLFCDLRGFTGFAGVAEPEDVVDLLSDYYEHVVEVLSRHHASIGSFAGDGIMAYFGDPMPVDDAVGQAVRSAVALRRPLDDLLRSWRDQGFALGWGIGIAYGYATLGVIGSGERSDYTALGSVVNLAARLSDEARTGEVLLDHRALVALGEHVESEERRLHLKGFDGEVIAHSLVPPSRSAPRAHLRVVGGER